MTKRFPDAEGSDRHFERRSALHAIEDDYGFTTLEAWTILGTDPVDLPRRHRKFREIADSMEDVMEPEEFRAIWNVVVRPSLIESGYDVEHSRHRSVIRDRETGEEVAPAAALKHAKTVFERWQEPDGPEVVSTWFKGFEAARAQ
ncbi:MAG: hypothetical protein Q8Q11_01095 [bacterium]|nr:hypothetical protein [bacterium]